MTQNLIENMQVYLLTKDVTRYYMIYFGNSSKIGTCFYNTLYIMESDVEISRIYFHFMGYNNTFKKKEKESGVTELIIFLEGQI